VAGDLKTLHGSRIGLPGLLLCIERRQCTQNTQSGGEQTVAQNYSNDSGYFVTVVFLSYRNDHAELRLKRAKAVTHELPEVRKRRSQRESCLEFSKTFV
jgi:hypothetical protein